MMFDEASDSLVPDGRINQFVMALCRSVPFSDGNLMAFDYGYCKYHNFT